MTRMPDPNAPECDCRSLEHWAKEPSVPIEFDARLNEYHIAGGGHQIMIYHCPFCGGRTPRSRRDEMFMYITDAEMERLRRITQDVKSLADVFAAFGPPDLDDPTGHGHTRDDSTGRPQTTYYRTLTYKDLSPTANVRAVVDLNGDVRFSFMPKDLSAA